MTWTKIQAGKWFSVYPLEDCLMDENAGGVSTAPCVPTA